MMTCFADFITSTQQADRIEYIYREFEIHLYPFFKGSTTEFSTYFS